MSSYIEIKEILAKRIDAMGIRIPAVWAGDILYIPREYKQNDETQYY